MLAARPPPVQVGGLQQGEEALGFMQLRLKRHRWFPKILKNRDPLVFSGGRPTARARSPAPACAPCCAAAAGGWEWGLAAAPHTRELLSAGELLSPCAVHAACHAVGWRRFQSLPVLATEDNNGRYRCARQPARGSLQR